MTVNKERPILFSAPMVKAILAGSKTQTRRIAKPRKTPSLLDGSWIDTYVLDEGNRSWLMQDNPYGAQGDHLWVKETHYLVYAQGDANNRVIEIDYRADDNYTSRMVPQKWRPSIFMPRFASRIQLEIIGVRLERLKAISENDAAAEGVMQEEIAPGIKRTAYSEFKNLWCTIHSGESWDSNPWVWVIEFRRIEK